MGESTNQNAYLPADRVAPLDGTLSIAAAAKLVRSRRWQAGWFGPGSILELRKGLGKAGASAGGSTGDLPYGVSPAMVLRSTESHTIEPTVDRVSRIERAGEAAGARDRGHGQVDDRPRDRTSPRAELRVESIRASEHASNWAPLGQSRLPDRGIPSVVIASSLVPQQARDGAPAIAQRGSKEAGEGSRIPDRAIPAGMLPGIAAALPAWALLHERHEAKTPSLAPVVSRSTVPTRHVFGVWGTRLGALSPILEWRANRTSAPSVRDDGPRPTWSTVTRGGALSSAITMSAAEPAPPISSLLDPTGPAVQRPLVERRGGRPLMPVSQLEDIAVSLRMHVTREVAQQVARVPAKETARVPTAPSPTVRAVPTRQSEDDMARRLLDRIRALAQEERFRSGVIR